MSFLFLLVFIKSPPTFANLNTIDSLEYALSNATSDSERLSLMDALVDELLNRDVPQALALAQKELDLSRATKNKRAEAIAKNNLGLILYETDERIAALCWFEESEQLAEELGLLELQAHNLMSIAKYYRYTAKDSTKTIQYFLKSAEVSKTANFHWGTGRSYAKLASFYTKYNQVELCETYLELAASYYAKYHDGAKTIAHYYNEVGDKLWHIDPKKSMDLYFKGRAFSSTPSLMVSLAKAYSYTGDYGQAIQHLQEAIPRLRKEEKRRGMLGVAIAQMAEVHIKLGEYLAANKACDEGIELLTNLGRSDQKSLPAFYRVKGIIMEQEDNDQAALKYYTKSLEEAIRVRYTVGRIKAALTLGSFYVSRDTKKGKIHCKKALKDAKKGKHTSLEISACDCLYKLYKEEASYIDALQYHEQKLILSDSLNTIRVKHAIDINSTITEKDQLIAEQSHQKELQEKELKNQYLLNNSLFTFMLLSLLMIGFLTMNYRRIREKNKEIKEKTKELVQANLHLERSNKELERFAYITSHDLKAPLRNILNFTGLLRQKFTPKDNPTVSHWITFIDSSGKRMHHLIEDILEFSQLTSNRNNQPERIDLNQLVEEITQLSKNTDGTKTILFEVSTLPDLKWYHSKVFLLFKNLIENGIKYNQSEFPTIKIYCTENIIGRKTICIEDNGIGIEQEYFDKIFIMFNRLHTKNEYEGTGLGLATCKKIVDEFEGKISITSEVNQGTIFKIELPHQLIQHSSNKNEERSLVLVES